MVYKKMIQEKLTRSLYLIWQVIYLALARVFADVTEKKIRSIVIIVLASLIFWKADFLSGLNWIIFLSFIFYRWEGEILSAGSFIFLIFCFILIFLQEDILAEAMAVQSFFLLAMSVVLQTVEFNWKKRNKSWGLIKDVFSKENKQRIEEMNIGGATNSAMLGEKKAAERTKKRTIYFLLLSFLAVEMAVVFFSWSLIAGVFWYGFVFVAFFPKKTLKVLFVASIVLSILAVASLVLSQKEQNSMFSLWLFLVFALIVEALIVGRLGKE
jgi:hypothetical protein